MNKKRCVWNSIELWFVRLDLCVTKKWSIIQKFLIKIKINKGTRIVWERLGKAETGSWEGRPETSRGAYAWGREKDKIGGV